MPLWLGAGVTPASAPVDDAAVLTLTLSPASVVGGNPVTGTVTLSAPAPVGGTVVRLTTSSITVAGLANPRLGPFSVVATISVAVPQGQSTVSFQVRTFGVPAAAAVNIGAATGTESATATLTVIPASVRTVAISPGAVVGGASATGTVTLDGQAPAGSGLTVALSTSDASGGGGAPAQPTTAASVPAALQLPPNATQGTFPVTTSPTAVRRIIVVTASLGQSVTASLAVAPPTLTAVRIEPSAVIGGRPATGTVVLNGGAPADGYPVALRSSGAASIPASVTVPAGKDRATFAVGTPAVTSVTAVTVSAASAQAGGATVTDGTSNTINIGAGVTGTLSLFPVPQLLSISASPSQVIGGSPLAITLAVAVGAGTGTTIPAPIKAGIVVDRPDLVQLPAAVAVPAGGVLTVSTGGLISPTATGTTTTPSADQTVTITATLEGRSASTAVLVRKPPPVVASFTLRPTTVRGGTNVFGSIQLGAAITTPTAVTLTTDHPELVQLPPSITVSPSPVPQPFTMSTSAVTAPVTVTITAAAGGQSVASTLTITP